MCSESAEKTTENTKVLSCVAKHTEMLSEQIECSSSDEMTACICAIRTLNFRYFVLVNAHIFPTVHFISRLSLMGKRMSTQCSVLTASSLSSNRYVNEKNIVQMAEAERTHGSHYHRFIYVSLGFIFTKFFSCLVCVCVRVGENVVSPCVRHHFICHNRTDILLV